MRSFTTVAVLALAASTASPVLSAPVRDNQAQVRAELEERANMTPFLKELAKYGLFGAVFGEFEKLANTGSSSQSGNKTTKRTPEPFDLFDYLAHDAAGGLGKTLGKKFASSSTSQITQGRFGNNSPPTVVITAKGTVDKRDMPVELLVARILRRAVNELE